MELKIASLNGEYDPKARWSKGSSVENQHRCCRIIIDKPDRLCSVDETEVTTNMSGGSTMGRTSSERIVKARDEFDKGETITNKISQCASMYGGSFASWS